MNYKIHFVTYGDRNFTMSRKRISLEAKKLGLFCSINTFKRKDAIIWFEEAPQNTIDTFNSHRGGGYMMWKPHAIISVLDKINEGEFVVYADAGCTIYKEHSDQLLELIKIVSNHPSGVLRFQNNFQESDFTKRSTFETIFDNDISSIKKAAISKQFTTNRIIIRKCKESMKQVKMWKSFTFTNPEIFNDLKTEPYPGFQLKDHRHDQSVWSLIGKKYHTASLPMNELKVIVDTRRRGIREKIRRTRLIKYLSTLS